MLNSKSIFISEVRKRLAKKRKLKAENLPKILDQIPLEKIKYHRQSLLLSYKDFKNNQKYIDNFIKENSYKSIFCNKKNTIPKNTHRNAFQNYIIQSKKNNISKIMKYNITNNSFRNLDIKKTIKNIKSPKKTPFQIGHIKSQFLREYINNSKQKNNNENMKEESNIQSFSINKYNEKKKIFGKSSYNNKILIKKYKIPKFYINDVSQRNNYSHFKIKYRKNNINYEERKILKNNCSLKLLKPNCYFNKINLDKISKIISSYENSI